jgi:tRNA A-37 threonylcarbamoyl transferase component Bud32
VTSETNVDDYEVLSPLGQGGMARVSKARYRPTGEHVALKEMLPHIAQSDGFVARFEREVRASAALVHENVVRVQGFGVTPPTMFLALEFCDGGTLVDVLKRAPRLPPAAVALWLSQLLAALEVAHAQGIVHRDIKPANVLCTRAGLVKLSDFGIARLAGDETLTATGEIIGTPAYMSPEQALGEKTIDRRSDLYSLGMLAYRLLAGANPYQSDNVATSLLRQTTGPSLQTADALPACPAVLERVIDGLLQKDRERRTPSARAALDALQPLVDEVSASVPDLGARLVADPAGCVRALFIDAAVAELRAARAALPSSAERAGIAAFRARVLAPEHPEASQLVDEISSKHGLTFGPVDDPRVQQAEAELQASPESPATLRKLANLYRGHKNPVLAARYLKRYVTVKPDDVVARQQLANLVGEHEVTEVIAVPSRPLSVRTSPRGVSTQELMQGVRTGGLRAPSSPARATSALSPSPLASLPYQPPEAPPERSMPWALVGGVVVVAVVVAVISVRAFIRSGQESLDRNLRATAVADNGVMKGFVAETQRPLLERGEASLRVGDFQGAIEAFNFALAADQDLSSPLAGRLLLRRAQANDGLGNAKQALFDFRMAVTSLAPGSPERADAESGVARLERIVH